MSVFITILWHKVYVCGSTVHTFIRYNHSTQLSSQLSSIQLSSNSPWKCCLHIHFVFPFCLMLEHEFHFVRHYLCRKRQKKTKHFFVTDSMMPLRCSLLHRCWCCCCFLHLLIIQTYKHQFNLSLKFAIVLCIFFKRHRNTCSCVSV